MISVSTLVLFVGLQQPIHIPNPDGLPIILANEPNAKDDRGEVEPPLPKIHSAQLLKMNASTLQDYASVLKKKKKSRDGFDSLQITLLARAILYDRNLIQNLLYNMSKLKTVPERKSYLKKFRNIIDARLAVLEKKRAALGELPPFYTQESDFARIFFSFSADDIKIIREFEQKTAPITKEQRQLIQVISILVEWQENPEIGPRPK